MIAHTPGCVIPRLAGRAGDRPARDRSGLVTGALLAVVATLVLTLLATALWIAHVPAEITGIPTLLWLVGGFGVLFFTAAIYGLRKLAARPATAAGQVPDWLQEPAAAEHLRHFPPRCRSCCS